MEVADVIVVNYGLHYPFSVSARVVVAADMHMWMCALTTFHARCSFPPACPSMQRQCERCSSMRPSSQRLQGRPFCSERRQRSTGTFLLRRRRPCTSRKTGASPEPHLSSLA